MTTISVAVRIWTKTVFLFSVFIGFASILEGDFFKLLKGALAIIFGFIIALPLLLPIYSLVDISKRLLQYSIQARIAWLTFFLIVLFFLFYVLVAKVINYRFVEFDKFFAQFLLVTIGILVIAVVTTHKSLNKLYTQSK